MLNYAEGVLVECDPSIKAIICRINEQHNHEIIIEEIDDEHILIKKDKHDDLKHLLKEVGGLSRTLDKLALTALQALKDTVKEAEETSESE